MSPAAQVGGIGGGDREDQRRHHGEDQRDPVDAYLVGHTEGGDPRGLLDQLEPAGAVEAGPGEQQQDQWQRGDARGQPSLHRLRRPATGEHEDGADEWHGDRCGEHCYLRMAAAPTRTTSPTTRMT